MENSDNFLPWKQNLENVRNLIIFCAKVNKEQAIN